MKKGIILVVIFVVVLVASIVSVKYNQKTTKKYEYYTFKDKRGISDYCSSKDRVECEIKGVLVEVRQFSKLD